MEPDKLLRELVEVRRGLAQKFVPYPEQRLLKARERNAWKDAEDWLDEQTDPKAFKARKAREAKDAGPKSQAEAARWKKREETRATA